MSITADAPAVITAAVVHQYARELARKVDPSTLASTLLLRAQPVWNGPDVVQVSGGEGQDLVDVAVQVGVSSLAIREAMARREPGDLLIILTDRPDDDLGLGILSRCYHQRIVTPSMWEAVQGAFRARQVDSRLSRLNWVTGPLLQYAPAGGWPIAPAGIVTREHALSHLTAAILGLPADDLDPSAILSWTLNADAMATFREQPTTVREGLIEWVSESVSPVAGIAMRSVTQGHSVNAISMGLAADVLWADSDSPVNPDVIAARTRLEGWTGVQNLPAGVARSFADAARGAAQRLKAAQDPAYPGLLTVATNLFSDLHFAEGAAASTILPPGFDARLRAVAQGVRAFLDGDANAISRVEVAFADLLTHEQAEPGDRATGVARMAVRLTRWLSLPDENPMTSLWQAAARQARESSYVDWAAADVWVGSTDPEVASTWAALFHAVRVRRDQHDRQFADLLAQDTARGVLPDEVTPIENLVARTLVPLSKANRVLLIVVDGMSTAVAAELTDQVKNLGWFEAVPEADPARAAALAVLPTLTRYSRTSLFVGSLSSGGQSEERSGFAALTGGTVFHKADLVGDAGQALPTAVTQAMRSEAKVTAVVLNTVDDALSKADPGGTDWTVQSIQHLRALLDEAARSERTVVLTSDHGHVVERGGTARMIEGAEARWRPVSTGPVDVEHEVALSGPRVLADGGSIIAAVDESLRYGTKQAGYHGGASAAECVIPVIVLSRAPEDLAKAGWVPAAPQAPAWWNNQIAAPVSITAEHASKPKVKRVEAAGQEALDIGTIEPAAPAAGAPAHSALIEAVMASEMYATQRTRGGARAVPEENVRTVLSVLLEYSGRVHQDTLAAAAGIPVGRISTTISALQRQLNVEGYTVIGRDVDRVTITLDEALLREQYLDGGAR